MSLQILTDVPDSKKFAPKVDGETLVIEAVSGEAGKATLNKTGLTADGGVSYWDATNKRFKTSSVDYTKLNVLDVTLGTAAASKALVLDASKNVVGINSLTSTTLNATTATVTTLSVTTATIGTLTVPTSFKPTGTVDENIRLLTNKGIYIQSDGGTDRKVIGRATSTRVLLGNSTDYLYFVTNASNDLVHFKGSSSGKIWSELNQGAGTGMDSDTLDGEHGSYYRNASNLNAGTVSTSRLPTGITSGSTTVNANFSGAVYARKNNFGVVELELDLAYAVSGSGLIALGQIPAAYAPSTFREFTVVKHVGTARSSAILIVGTDGNLSLRPSTSSSTYTSGDDILASVTWLI